MTTQSHGYSPTPPPRRVAVVGSGGAGLSAALFLHDAGLHVSLFEAEERLGGHCLTLPLPESSSAASSSSSSTGPAGPCVDVGFQVFNLTTYPIFSSLLQRLQVTTRPSEMSFSLSALREGADPKSPPFEWASHGLSSIFTSFARFFSPSVWIMIADMMRWNWTCPQILNSPKKWAHVTVGEYLKQCRYTKTFRELYLLPMCSAIWSMPSADCLDMPILTLVRFFKNHCLLNMPWRRPLWRVVQGGSSNYVNKISDIVDQVYSGTRVIKLEAINKGRDGMKVFYSSSQGNGSSKASLQCQHFDIVILCCHTPESLQIIKNSMSETSTAKDELAHLCSLLEKLEYSSSRVVVHSDKALMPRDKRVWASWNCFRTVSSKDQSKQREPVFVTYWGNRLQQDSLRDYKDVFVTLNSPAGQPDKRSIYAEYNLQHPILTATAFDVQEKINSTFFNGSLGLAGAWARYGFHEDAMKSTLNVLEKLAVDLPSYVHEAKSLVPFPTWRQWLDFQTFKFFAEAAIKKGKFIVILPSGHELEFGSSCEGGLESKIQVTDWSFFGSVLRESDIGLGKSYILKMYHPSGSTTLVALMGILSLNANNAYNVRGRQGLAASVTMIAYRYWNWLRRNTISNSKTNISDHYDIGDEFYKIFLDTSLTYSAAIFSEKELEAYKKIFYSGPESFRQSEEKLLNLDCLYAAQMRKLDKIIEIGDVDQSSSILEIGCGWGSFMNRCIERGVGKSITALTISQNQYKHAQKVAENARDGCEITVAFCDYREISKNASVPPEGFDRIVSIEMLEAVGHENLRHYFGVISNSLAPGGVAVIQVICTKDENYADYCRTSDFIRACIFPGGHFPCVDVIRKSLPKDLTLSKVVDIGEHYAPTLFCWRNALLKHAHSVDESLRRRFEFYFAYCEAGFATGHIRNCIIRLEKL